MSEVVLLVALLGGCVASGGAVPPADSACAGDPCACGAAWSEPAGSSASVAEAVAAAPGGATVHVCPGRWAGQVYVGPKTGGPIHLVGAGVDVTTLTSAEGDAFSVIWAQDSALRVADLTIAEGRGSTGWDESKHANHRYGGGLYVCESTVELERVRMADNSADLGGALATCGGAAEVVLTDSEIVRNVARGWGGEPATGGGAWLQGAFRLTSVATDWGTGTTDNHENDVAIGTRDGPFTGYAEFGADAAFECTAEAGRCE